MLGIPPLTIAATVGLLGLVASYGWFRVIKKRIAQEHAGVKALAAMKWRECAGLVIQSLEKEGYREELSSKQPGDGGSEFLLSRNGEKVLLNYKHGTAYNIGEANIRDFANAVQLIGAKSGLLVTLGSIDGMARDVAKKYSIELISGDKLWGRIEPFVSPTLLESVDRQASAETSSNFKIAAGSSLATACFLFFFLSPSANNADAPAPSAASVETPSTDSVPAEPAPPAQAPSPAAAPTKQASASEMGKAAAPASLSMEEIDLLSMDEKNKRRKDAASTVATLPRVNSAMWSTQSTLSVSLSSVQDNEDNLTAEICRILTQREELRYTRVQLDPPAGSTAKVRWRQCK